jgi:hypothetical protein
MTLCGFLHSRFTQTDPMPYGAGSSFESAYVYGMNSPLVFVDPSGRRGMRVGSVDLSNPIAGVSPAFSGKAKKSGKSKKSIEQYEAELGAIVARVEARTGLNLSEYSAGIVTACVNIVAIGGRSYKDKKGCHRGVAANREPLTLSDDTVVDVGTFAIGTNAFDLFGPEGEMGIVFHEMVHLIDPGLSERMCDCAVQGFGIKNEKKGSQNSLTYAKGNCSKREVEDAVGVVKAVVR